jgi:hypothetical protein
LRLRRDALAEESKERCQNPNGCPHVVFSLSPRVPDRSLANRLLVFFLKPDQAEYLTTDAITVVDVERLHLFQLSEKLHLIRHVPAPASQSPQQSALDEKVRLALPDKSAGRS